MTYLMTYRSLKMLRSGREFRTISKRVSMTRTCRNSLIWLLASVSFWASSMPYAYVDVSPCAVVSMVTVATRHMIDTKTTKRLLLRSVKQSIKLMIVSKELKKCLTLLLQTHNFSKTSSSPAMDKSAMLSSIPSSNSHSNKTSCHRLSSHLTEWTQTGPC